MYALFATLAAVYASSGYEYRLMRMSDRSGSENREMRGREGTVKIELQGANRKCSSAHDDDLVAIFQDITGRLFTSLATGVEEDRGMDRCFGACSCSKEPHVDVGARRESTVGIGEVHRWERGYGRSQVAVAIGVAAARGS